MEHADDDDLIRIFSVVHAIWKIRNRSFPNVLEYLGVERGLGSDSVHHGTDRLCKHVTASGTTSIVLVRGIVEFATGSALEGNATVHFRNLACASALIRSQGIKSSGFDR